ncbi:guanidinobutyrase-like [Oratosquilla oratoria]|uniref:guanidinobutyrase-like n=1 Tax=Oratosquilla oratoria TaxID=337810 RepID=UPI003F772F50
MLRTASNVLTRSVGMLGSSCSKTSLASASRTTVVSSSFGMTRSRHLHRCPQLQNNFPPSGNDFARPSGIASFMRLPVQETSDGLDVCFVGVPLDIGCSNRTGARFGPRQIRSESPMVRAYQQVTGADPFSSLMVADIGDVFLNFYNLPEAAKQIADQYRTIIKNGCVPLSLGGDHTITYPILQAIKEKHGPVGLIHIDAHTDVSDTVLGATISHGTVFRRAVEENLIDPKISYQIGLRGSSHTLFDYDWSREQGFRVVLAQDLWYKSAAPLMEEVRSRIGDRPTYISFDIDGIDPCYCPGTGTPEIGGLTTIQALEIVRGCRGINVIGGDVVEVSPPFDTTGTTALTAANLLFEMLCILPGVKYHS